MLRLAASCLERLPATCLARLDANAGRRCSRSEVIYAKPPLAAELLIVSVDWMADDKGERTQLVSAVSGRSLVERRTQPGRWMFAATGIVLVVFGLLANEYDTLVPYGTLGAVCLVQFWYPTMVGWAFVLALYGGASVLYGYVLTADVIRVAQGRQPEVFLNPTDTTVILVCLSVLILLTLAVARSRPVRLIQGL